MIPSFPRIVGCLDWLLALAACFFIAASPSAFAQKPVEVQVQEPRSFGYTVGDTVTRGVTLLAPAPLKLDADSLPKPGRLGHALELRDAILSSAPATAGTRYRLNLTYQIFLAPAEVKTIDLPSLTVSLQGGTRPQEARIDYWPITVAPLAPVEASLRNGLGALRPNVEPPLLDVSRNRFALLGLGAAVAALLLYLAYVYFGLPFLASHRRPFARAYRQVKNYQPVKSNSGELSGQAFRYLCKRMHSAFNETAGSVVFAENVDQFVARQPRFAPLQNDIAAFFGHSRSEFFGGGKTASPDAHWLIAFARNCRDLERASA